MKEILVVAGLVGAALLVGGCPAPLGAFVDLAESRAQPQTEELGTFVTLQAAGGRAVRLSVAAGRFQPQDSTQRCVVVTDPDQPDPTLVALGFLTSAEPFSEQLRVVPDDREAIVLAELLADADAGDDCVGDAVASNQLAVSTIGNRGVRQIEREDEDQERDAGTPSDGGSEADPDGGASTTDGADAGGTAAMDGGSDAG